MLIFWLVQSDPLEDRLFLQRPEIICANADARLGQTLGKRLQRHVDFQIYMHRGAISNKDIVAYDGENVSFKYTESNSDVVRYRTLPALEFIRLCLRHILPSGFQKTRYYGLLASANRKTVRELRLMILRTRCSRVPELEDFTLEPLTCRKCGMPMRFCGTYSRAPPNSLISPGGEW
jgi:hypothetical protein